jgi:hypothetical protein
MIKRILKVKKRARPKPKVRMRKAASPPKTARSRIPILTMLTVRKPIPMMTKVKPTVKTVRRIPRAIKSPSPTRTRR